MHEARETCNIPRGSKLCVIVTTSTRETMCTMCAETRMALTHHPGLPAVGSHWSGLPHEACHKILTIESRVPVDGK